MSFDHQRYNADSLTPLQASGQPATPVTTSGAISGQIANGRGYKVRLLQGDTLVAEQIVDDNLAFRFEGLPFGTYRLEAVSPHLTYDNIVLETNDQQVWINLTAA
jgi:hypothetical protein